MENKKFDGGPAFPCDGITTYKGVSVRDYFATKAMQGIMSQTENGVQHIPDAVAEWAFSIADAMLEAREK